VDPELVRQLLESLDSRLEQARENLNEGDLSRFTHDIRNMSLLIALLRDELQIKPDDD
jgi:hypothetical protein